MARIVHYFCSITNERQMYTQSVLFWPLMATLSIALDTPINTYPALCVELEYRQIKNTMANDRFQLVFAYKVKIL